jgi:pSer/pThr/pTyr-binding forkhead associated (FHA) protein
MVWTLHGSEPERGSFSFRLSTSVTRTLGRAQDADFIVDAPLVSRRHCRFEAGLDALRVIDLESTNGTFVNGQRVEQVELRDGDRVRIGRINFTVSRLPVQTA